MKCKTCNGRGKVQSGYAGEELIDCPDCTPCGNCGGKGSVDSGGVTPWGAPIDLPCPQCTAKWDDLAIIGAAWRKDSSLEKWFPFTAEELAKLKALNEDKAKTIAAYCRMASLDKWRVRKLMDAIDRYLSEDGYRDASSILTNARADAINAKPSAEIAAQPLCDDELDNKRFPTGLLKKYAFNVPDDDVDREYCTGYNHGLVLAETFIEDTFTNPKWIEQKRQEEDQGYRTGLASDGQF